MLDDLKEFELDILIIGSGGAGLRAAIEARKANCSVQIVSKTGPGKGTSTQVSGGFFRIAADDAGKTNHAAETIEAGKYINNRELVEILVEEAPIRVKELDASGLPLTYLPGWARCKMGVLSDFLSRQAQESGVIIHSPVIVTDLLLTSDGVITGALGFNFESGDMCLYKTKAIIIAAGGVGQLFKWNDNPPRTTGDGFVLAYQAGVRLQDMEMVQVYPIGAIENEEFGTPLPPHLFLRNRLTNSRGEEFLGEELAAGDAVKARDMLSRLIGNKLFEQQEHQGLFLDLPGISDQEDGSRLGELTGVDLKKRFLKVAPVAHFQMGGIMINSQCETGIPGLYAAGEVSGGLHGANRLAGNALSEILVFGARAGIFASQYSKNIHPSTIHRESLEMNLEKLKNTGKLTQTGNILPGEVKKKIKEVNHAKGGWIVRSKQILEQILDGLHSIEAEWCPRIRANTPRRLLEYLEVMNMLEVSRYIAKSALQRTESRGAHYRSDFPETKSDWQKNIILSKNINE